MLRRDFNIQYSMPLMCHFLELMKEGSKNCVVKYADVFAECPPNAMVINGFAERMGINVTELSWKYDSEAVQQIVHKEFEPLLKKVATIMFSYACDVVLLSGRPASLPAIRDIFLKYYPVSPNRLIVLNNYYVGDWYPFGENTGHVKNAKTIVAMGGVIGHYASALSNLDKFSIKLDLLDFPGARSREKYKEREIGSVLPKMLRRGKVAYLFNKYSRSLRISSVLFCHHNDQKAEATIGETINSWIEDNIGATPEERAHMLNSTNGIAPLFMIATKFNIDLERTKTDNVSNPDKLDAHWNRFDTVFPEIIKPDTWLDHWVKPGGLFKTAAFQNIYPLRDFYWSGKNGVFDGYSDGVVKSEEKCVHTFEDYPDYFDNLKQSFMRNEFVKRHFANPGQTWNDVATVNNDGSKAIIRNLDAIAGVLDAARCTKYGTQLAQIKDEMCKALSVYFEPEDKEAKNLKVKQIASDIRLSLILSVGERPEVFGRIIDSLMVPVSDLRDIAYDIIICHADTPRDFSMVNFVRKQVDIDPTGNKADNVRKLCEYFGCDTAQLEQALKARGCTVDEVVESQTETLTTVADVVAKHIVDYWTGYINSQVKMLEPMLPHADEVVFMLASLLKKMKLRNVLAERIGHYCNVFSPDEQLNAIADYAALTLNNFVSTAGRSYISDSEADAIRAKAETCHIKVDLSPAAWTVSRKPQPLLETLRAFDAASDISHVDKHTLTQLPLWDNFQRWENLVTIGLLYASDISHTDPVANAQIKRIIDSCSKLYGTHND